MAWIESHTVLMRHRKLIGIAGELKIRRSHALGHLHALWHTAIEQQENGDLSTWTDAMIADAADFNGDPKRLVQALKRQKWIEKDRRLHDWWDYAGPFLRSKYKRNPEKWEQIRNRYVTVTVPVTSPPNRTEPNLTNLTKPTEPEQGPVDLSGQFKKQLSDIADRKARAAKEDYLLALRWKLGEHNGKKVQDLPTDYCAWALNGGLTGIGQEYRDALTVRLEQKTSEAIQ